MNLSAHEREELRSRFAYSTPWWAGGMRQDSQGQWHRPGPQSFQGCARIIDKRKQTVPLIAHPWQLELDDALEVQRSKGLPMRAIVLKARKLGFSTWVAAKYLQRLTQLPNQHAIIVAQDTKTAGVIFDMAKRMYSYLPDEQALGLGFNIKPDLIAAHFSANGRKYMEFGERSRALRMKGRVDSSILEIDTAKAPESGRGYTPSLVHLSEVARWPESATSGPQSKMLAILNAVPYVEETCVVQESTANGMNFFYRRWSAAVDGVHDPELGESYAPVFVPWWRDPECALAFENASERDRFVESISDTKRLGELAEDEEALQELYDCSPEQLRWRRMMVRTQHEGNVDLFKQENPASPEEAFILSGRPFFSSILVAKAIKAAEAAPAPMLGSLTASGWTEKRSRSGSVWLPTGAVWVPEEKMRRGAPWNEIPGVERESSLNAPMLEVWEHPVTLEAQADLPAEERRPEGAYVIAVDVAEGEQDTFTEGDFHALTVWDHRSRTQVAQYMSRIDRHLLALWVLLVALYYNRGWLAVEVNSVGVAVSDPLVKDYRYGRMYRRRRRDTVRNLVDDKPGWKTQPDTKPLIEQAMGDALSSDTRGGIRSPLNARQLQTYVMDDKGRRGAMAGEHDDLLMTDMIAQRVMEEIRPPRTDRKKRVRVVGDDVTGY